MDPNNAGSTSVASNPLCSKWDNTTRICLQCANRAYFNNQGVCILIDNQCNTWDRYDGFCLTCYAGYNLFNGTCILAQQNATASVADLGCRSWNGSTCLQCSVGWVFNSNSVCISVSDQCKTNDAKGNCLSCYAGYDLANGTCTYSSSNVAKPADGGCRNWDWANSKCTQCSTNWIFNSNGLCVTVSDQCRSSNDQGKCTGCFKGYDLVNGSCNFSPSNTATPSDIGCKVWNWDNNTCLQCSLRWYFGSSGFCAAVSDSCKTFDQNSGVCLSCFSGYILVNSTCAASPSNSAAPSDLGCAVWNGTVCLSCSYRWIFSNGTCVALSDQCKTFNSFACASCYQGYVLANGTCIPSPFNIAAPKDPGCALWNWNSQVCLACSKSWTFKNGTCQIVSDQCKSYDLTSGACTSCFKGYDLIGNTSCVLSPSSTKGPTDLGCQEWAWDNQTCLQCSPYFVMKSGTCSGVSDYCKSYDNSTGLCTSCYQGYGLSNGTCTASLNFCRTSDSFGCLTCYSGYALYQKQCVLMQNLANIALYYAECCPEKLAALIAAGRLPSS